MLSIRLSKFIALTLFVLLVMTMFFSSAVAASRKSVYTVKVENGVLTVYKNGAKMNPTYPINSANEVTLSAKNGRLVLTFTDKDGKVRSLVMGNAATDEFKIQGKIPLLTLDKSLNKTTVTIDAKAKVDKLNVNHDGTLINYGTIGQCVVNGAATLWLKNKSIINSLRVANSRAVINIDKKAVVNAFSAVPGVTVKNKNTEISDTLSYVALPPSPSPTTTPIFGGGGGDSSAYVPPAVSVANVTVVNATTVTVTMDQLYGTLFTWNNEIVTGTYAGGKYTLTVPKITGTANTLVVKANGFSTKTIPVTVTSSAGNLILIANTGELSTAMLNQADGQSWIIKSGTYDLPMDKVFRLQGVDENWYFPIHKSVTISGEGAPTLTSSTFSANGNWSTQNFITVIADDVTIQGLNIRCKFETNKVIEVLGKNFTLKNVNILANTIPKDPTETTKGEVFSGSIYFNPCRPNAGGAVTKGNDVGYALLENVNLSAWVTVPTSVTNGTVMLKNVTNDFRNNFYADYLWNGARYEYSVVSKNAVVKAQGYTVLIDNKVYDLQNNVLSKVPAGSKVIFAPGTYYVSASLNIPAGVEVDQSAANIVIGRLIYAAPGEIASTIYNLKKDDVLMLNAGEYTISGQAYLFEDNIKIIGAGIDKTIIKVQNEKTGWGITISGALSPARQATNAYLEGFTIQRGVEAGTQNVIKVNADHATLKSIKIVGGKGIDVNPSVGTVLDGVSVMNSIGASIAVAGGSEVTISNSTTTNGAWGSLGVMENGAVSSVTIGANNVFNEGVLYSEKYSTKGNQITGLGSEWISFISDTDQFVYAKQLPKGAYITTGTETKGYSTIQAALAAAVHGDTITIGAGNYDIDAGIALTDDVTLIGNGSVTLTADQAPVARTLATYHGKNPIVWIQNANVTIRNITVTSVGIPNNTAIDGITALNSFVTLDGVAVTNIMNVSGYNGNQYGRGYTGREGSQSIITDCTFTGFNKNGVHFYGAGVTGSVDDCTFVGTYQTPGSTAQNGVVFHNGATGSVTNSSFDSLWYIDTVLDEAAGVLVYGSGSFATIEDNTFTRVQLPIATADGGTMSESGNTIVP